MKVNKINSDIFSLTFDFFYWPIHIFKKISKYKLGKVLYKLNFFFIDPGSIIDHFNLYRLENNTRKKYRKYVNISMLTNGHNVSEDDYFNNRLSACMAANVKDLKKLPMKQLRVLMPADTAIEIFNNVVINGNGRVSVLKKSGFKGLVEIYERR